jgi:alpha-galactosidase
MRSLSLRAALTALTLAVGALTLTVAAPAAPAHALNNGLALTPPMGFNDWNAVGCGVTEAFIKQTADFFHSHVLPNGRTLQQVGYQYVNIDDCWAQPSRDASGDLVPNPTKFPDGISGTADYVHSLGLKLGLYNDSGTMTCSSSGFPGSFGHEAQDALQFAKWHVDYLKDDNCKQAAGQDTRAATIARYTAMRDGLAAAQQQTGQAIVFSICQKGDNGINTEDWSPSVGNLWRTTSDIHPDWSHLDSIIQKNIPLAASAGPGAWNDPDMLEIGNTGLTATEDQTHMAMWAEMAAPLLIGTKLATASAATLDILSNPDVIAVDQDSLGKQGVQIADNGGLRVLAKPLANGDVSVALFNETASTATIGTSASGVGLSGSSSYSLKDLWSKATTTTSGAISASVPSHGTVMFRVSRGGSSTGYEAEASANTRSGAATVISCAACSGGARVGHLGKQSSGTGTLTFNGIAASGGAGVYQIVFTFTNGSASRSAQISVDGGPPVTVVFGTTGSFTTPGDQTVALALAAGTDTISIANSSAAAPDIDKITVPSTHG